MNLPTLNPQHEILSEVHRILSVTSAEDLIAAASVCNSQFISRALKSLADELINSTAKTIGEDFLPKNVAKSPTSREKVETSRKLPSTGADFTREDLNNIRDILLSEPSLKKKAALIAFAEKSGLFVEVGYKDGRDRVVAQIVSHIKSGKGGKMLKAVKQLAEKNDYQVTGWYRLVRGLE